MKIIKVTKPETEKGIYITCNHCKSELEYNSSDVVTVEGVAKGSIELGKFIYCPVCNNEIKV